MKAAVRVLQRLAMQCAAPGTGNRPGYSPHPNRSIQAAASTSGWRTVRMRDRDDHQAIYPREVVRIARVEG
jgi:hypothetical protein